MRNGWQDSPRGAAIDMFESAPLLRNLVVVDNVSDWSPVGGIRAGSGSSPTLSNVVVARNVGRGGFAGGMLIEQSAATLEHIVFAANVAGMGFGGGLLVRDSSPVLLRNVVFAGNSEGVRVDGESVVTMVGLTVTGNLRDGLFVSAPAAVELRNAAVTLNGGTGLTVRSPSALLRASYCDAWGNAAGDVLGLTEPWETGGNLSADPGWLDVTGDRPLAWNLHLAAGSPLVDAGDPALSDPDGGRSDLGAWGGPVADGWDLDGDGYPNWWQPGPYDGDRYPGLGLDCDDQDPAVHPGAGC